MLSNSCTTTAYTSMDGHSSSADDEREPMLRRPSAAADDIQLYRLDGHRQRPAAAVALVPVIVPLASAAAVVGLQVDPTGRQTVAQSRRPISLRRHSSNASGVTREVKFDETVL